MSKDRIKFKRVVKKDTLIKLNPAIDFIIGDEATGETKVEYKTPITISQKERIETIISMFKMNGISGVGSGDEDYLLDIIENNFDVYLPEGQDDIHLLVLLSIFAIFIGKLIDVEAENKKK